MVAKANFRFIKGMVIVAKSLDIFAYYNILVQNASDIFPYRYVFNSKRIYIFAYYNIFVQNASDIFPYDYVFVAKGLGCFLNSLVHALNSIV